MLIKIKKKVTKNLFYLIIIIIKNFKMIFVKHRVNSNSDLKKTNTDFGVEIDLRSEKNNIYLHHDPFKKGESFERWIKKSR